MLRSSRTQVPYSPPTAWSAADSSVRENTMVSSGGGVVAAAATGADVDDTPPDPSTMASATHSGAQRTSPRIDASYSPTPTMVQATAARVQRRTDRDRQGRYPCPS